MPVDVGTLEVLARELEQALLAKVEQLAKVAEIATDWNLTANSSVTAREDGGWTVSITVDVTPAVGS